MNRQNKLLLFFTVTLTSSIYIFTSESEIETSDPSLRPATSERNTTNASQEILSNKSMNAWREKISDWANTIGENNHQAKTREIATAAEDKHETTNKDLIKKLPDNETIPQLFKNKLDDEMPPTDSTNESDEMEITIAYSSDTGLELEFYEDEESGNGNSIDELAIHQKMIDSQISSEEKEITLLHDWAINAPDPAVRLSAINKLTDSTLDQATLALIDIARKTHDDNRLVVIKSLSSRVAKDSNQKEKLLIALVEFTEDWDPVVADIARLSLTSSLETENTDEVKQSDEDPEIQDI